jgi:hypothetical protein
MRQGRARDKGVREGAQRGGRGTRERVMGARDGGEGVRDEGEDD